MKFDAFYFERVCTGNKQISYFKELMYEFIEKLRDGDIVAFVGCGKRPYSVSALDKLCKKDIEIVGIDPNLLYESKDMKSKRIGLIKKTLEDVLGVKSDSDFNISQNMVIHAINHDARVIGFYGCSCYDAGYENDFKLLNPDLNPLDHGFSNVKDILLFLEKNGYNTKMFGKNRYAILAEKASVPKRQKPEGMSDDLYDMLEQRGHFD